MSPHDITVTTLIIGFKTITLVLGTLITVLSYRAYRRTRDRSLAVLALGFATITLGTLIAGVADQLLQADFLIGLLIESALIAVGFVIIVVSLYATTNP